MPGANPRRKFSVSPPKFFRKGKCARLPNLENAPGGAADLLPGVPFHALKRKRARFALRIGPFFLPRGLRMEIPVAVIPIPRNRQQKFLLARRSAERSTS